MGGKRRKLEQRQTPSARKLKAQAGKKAALKPPPKPQKQKTKQQLEQAERQRQYQREHPTIPFDADDRILLVGEGDLSFAASLIKHYGCSQVTATVLERDHAELSDKYPSADENITTINEPLVRVVRTRASSAQGKTKDEEYTSDISDFEDEGYPESDEEDAKPTFRPASNKLLYHIDATKPPSSLLRGSTASSSSNSNAKNLSHLPNASSSSPLFTRILFNFPHVGGKSTDVNRQVRYNQELLVSFFTKMLPALAPGGTIVVTLFEGEPYTLWNVRDLARHAGLQVDRSFKFQSHAYPGYKHARTLGVIKSKKGDPGGGWKGEDRAARSYVFVRKGDVVKQPSGIAAALVGGSKKKRKRDGSDGESSGEE